jgi:hypothetical protein
MSKLLDGDAASTENERMVLAGAAAVENRVRRWRCYQAVLLAEAACLAS